MAGNPRSPQPADYGAPGAPPALLAIIERYTARALAHAGLLVQGTDSREARRVRNHLADTLAAVRGCQDMLRRAEAAQ